MKTLKYLGLAFMFLSLTTTTFGQRNQRMNKLESIKSQLDLTETQVATLEKLEEENKEKFKAIKENTELTSEERKAAFMEIQKETKETYNTTLTTAQKETLAKIREEKKAEHKVKMVERSQKMKEKRTEVRALRAEFDEQISAEDKSEIAELRAVFAQERKGMKTKGKEKMKAKEGKGDKEKMKARHEERQAKRDKFKSEHEEEIASLKELSEKYDSQIKAFMQEKGVNENREELKKDEKRKHKGKRKMQKGQMGNKSRADNKAARFLLMDFEKSENSQIKNDDSQLKIYPNPSSTWTNIDYNVRASGNVLVQIRDEQGNTVQTLVNEKSEAGTFTIEFNSSSLASKNYFIVVTDSQGVTSKSFVTVK